MLLLLLILRITFNHENKYDTYGFSKLEFIAIDHCEFLSCNRCCSFSWKIIPWESVLKLKLELCLKIEGITFNEFSRFHSMAQGKKKKKKFSSVSDFQDLRCLLVYVRIMRYWIVLLRYVIYFHHKLQLYLNYKFIFYVILDS